MFTVCTQFMVKEDGCMAERIQKRECKFDINVYILINLYIYKYMEISYTYLTFKFILITVN